MECYRIHPAAVYFVTDSVVDWLPVFVSDAACRIVTDSLQFSRKARQGRQEMLGKVLRIRPLPREKYGPSRTLRDESGPLPVFASLAIFA